MAQIATTGCHNGSKVFTKYLGTTDHYGTIHEVYSSDEDEHVITIYNNSDGTNTPKCDEIVPTGVTPTGGPQCWIAPNVPPTNSSAGASWQTKVNITGTYTPCPIDDYIPVIVVVVAGFGFFYLKTNMFSQA